MEEIYKGNRFVRLLDSQSLGSGHSTVMNLNI